MFLSRLFAAGRHTDYPSIACTGQPAKHLGATVGGKIVCALVRDGICYMSCSQLRVQVLARMG